MDPLLKQNSRMNVLTPSSAWWKREDGEEEKREIKKVDLDMNGKEAFILYDVLSPTECQHLIQKTEEMGYKTMPGYARSYRSNTRVIVDDPEGDLTNEIWKRVKPYIPHLSESQAIWRPYGLNERWRFCRYTRGQHFSAHFDGAFIVSGNDRSQLTLMLYLNGEFEGGTTNFLEGSKDSVKPVAGMALVFQHHIYHEGERLVSGTKYIMRSDVMFRRYEDSPRHPHKCPQKE